MITKKEFAEEERRMKKLRKDGKTEDWIKGWLRGWRQVGAALRGRRK
jgi:hypothetical protein